MENRFHIKTIFSLFTHSVCHEKVKSTNNEYYIRIYIRTYFYYTYYIYYYIYYLLYYIFTQM